MATEIKTGGVKRFDVGKYPTWQNSKIISSIIFLFEYRIIIIIILNHYSRTVDLCTRYNRSVDVIFPLSARRRGKRNDKHISNSHDCDGPVEIRGQRRVLIKPIVYYGFRRW